MTSFVKIQVGQTVFDSSQSVKGVVIEIDTVNNIAKLQVSTDVEEVVLSRLADLVVVNEGKPNSPVGESNKYYNLVKDFHVAFNHPVGNKPTPLTPDRALSRSVWTVEEIIEYLHSSVSNEDEFLLLYDKLLQGMEKAKQKSLDSVYPKTLQQKLVAQTDALVDALYFISGSFVESAVKPDKPFEIVQNSNMSKLFIDDNGIKYAKYRESDGKILKSPAFFEPEPFLKAEIERQSK